MMTDNTQIMLRRQASKWIGREENQDYHGESVEIANNVGTDGIV